MEAVIACIIIALFLIFMATGNTASSSNMIEEGLSYDILKSLDHRGLLRGYAESLNYSGLNEQVDLVQYNHSVTICTQTACYGSQPEADDVWAGSYFIAGNGVYSPREITLYIWRRFG